MGREYNEPASEIETVQGGRMAGKGHKKVTKVALSSPLHDKDNPE
jgi:hypothetical protein